MKHRIPHLASLVPCASVLVSLAGCTALVNGDRTFGSSPEQRGDGGGTRDEGGASHDGATPPHHPAYEQVAFLKSDEPVSHGAFGFPVHLTENGLLVGSAGATVSGLTHAGRGYVFDPTGDLLAPDSVFSQHPRVEGGVVTQPVPGSAGKPPGVSLASSDNTLVIGLGSEPAVLADGTSLEGAGAVYVFTRHGADWKFTQRVAAAEPHANDAFGFRLGISRNTLVVTAPWNDGADGEAKDSGAIYAFEREDEDKGFVERPILREEPVTTGNLFGSTFAFDATTAAGRPYLTFVTGTPVASPGDVAGAGAVHVYTKATVDGAFTREQVLTADVPVQAALFGTTMAIRGRTLAVSACYSARPGSAYVFEYDQSWKQVESLTQPNGTSGANLFGSSLALANDILVVGAMGDMSVGHGVDGDQFDVSTDSSLSGAAHVYERRAGSWEHLSYLKAERPHGGDTFGFSVAARDDLIAIGAPSESSGGSLLHPLPDDTGTEWAGAVYLFRRVAP